MPLFIHPCSFVSNAPLMSSPGTSWSSTQSSNEPPGLGQSHCPEASSIHVAGPIASSSYHYKLLSANVQALPDLNKGQLTSQIPLGRVGRAEEVADAAFFLATNSYANNCVLNIDGGLSAASQGFVSRGSS